MADEFGSWSGALLLVVVLSDGPVGGSSRRGWRRCRGASLCGIGVRHRRTTAPSVARADPASRPRAAKRTERSGAERRALTAGARADGVLADDAGPPHAALARRQASVEDGDHDRPNVALEAGAGADLGRRRRRGGLTRRPTPVTDVSSLAAPPLRSGSSSDTPATGAVLGTHGLNAGSGPRTDRTPRRARPGPAAEHAGPNRDRRSSHRIQGHQRARRVPQIRIGRVSATAANGNQTAANVTEIRHGMGVEVGGR